MKLLLIGSLALALGGCASAPKTMTQAEQAKCGGFSTYAGLAPRPTFPVALTSNTVTDSGGECETTRSTWAASDKIKYEQSWNVSPP